jgi:hypothetical protein
MSTANMKRLPRGEFDFRSDGTVYFVKWHDNSVVCLGSNCLTHEPVQQATRRVKGKSNVSVIQPYIVGHYNTNMGGVDLMDRLLASYRPSIRGKKWWFPLFTNALNTTVVAAWCIHKKVAVEPSDHLTFRRDITLCLLNSVSPRRLQVSGGPAASLPDDVRFDGVGHARINFSQGRCRICQKNTRTGCAKCQLRLHSDRGTQCFELYHTRQ